MSCPDENDPRIVAVKIWVDGELVGVWPGGFSAGENDTAYRMTPKITITKWRGK